jgi:predicted O-linked N-acetylglucosamine transferase (SPINDLY family)
VHPSPDEVTDCFRQLADHYIPLASSLTEMRQIIADQRLDILYYTDIGMEPVTYTLAQNRLAPIQCATWGHPVTTGLRTIDYFISSEALEVPAASSHYTEQLIRLPHLAVYYYRPPVPSPRAPGDFGLPANANLYGCLQSLQKFHPEFDAILSNILRRDSKGILVLLEGSPPEWTQLLKQRFELTMPEVIDQIRWIPRQNHEGYLQLNQLCTVMLDPIHFGGGNTTYESLALGVPVVTWPSQLLRGRLTYALYRTMNVLDCVAASHEEYVEIAVRLATNPEYGRALRQKIESTSQILFEYVAGIRELEAFFKESIQPETH